MWQCGSEPEAGLVQGKITEKRDTGQREANLCPSSDLLTFDENSWALITTLIPQYQQLWKDNTAMSETVVYEAEVPKSRKHSKYWHFHFSASKKAIQDYSFCRTKQGPSKQGIFKWLSPPMLAQNRRNKSPICLAAMLPWVLAKFLCDDVGPPQMVGANHVYFPLGMTPHSK